MLKLVLLPRDEYESHASYVATCDVNKLSTAFETVRTHVTHAQRLKSGRIGRSESYTRMPALSIRQMFTC